MIHPGAQLQLFLKRVKLNQTEAGELIGKDQKRASKWIKGDLKVPAELIKTLHQKYHMNLEWFYTGKGPLILKETTQKSPLVTDISELKNNIAMLTHQVQKLQADYLALHKDHYALKQSLKSNIRDTTGTHP
jgi:plasmid maintenance system antidote protein VapI